MGGSQLGLLRQLLDASDVVGLLNAPLAGRRRTQTSMARSERSMQNEIMDSVI